MESIRIETDAQYRAATDEGYQPLVNVKRFTMAHGLRVEKQHKLFGRGHTPAENERFYRWVWRYKPHICEECAKYLPEYSATFVSHILTRGAHPDMAHDPRNVNILCRACHDRWENGDRGAMRIYYKNQDTINLLKNEYYEIEK